MGTTTVGIPLALSDSASGMNSSLPVRKPGTITAARMLGRDGSEPPGDEPPVDVVYAARDVLDDRIGWIVLIL
jgi:hypothetical protein